MAKDDLSASYHQAVSSLSAEEPVMLLDITHQDLAETVRIVADNDDFPYGKKHTHETEADYLTGDIIIPPTYNGHYYVALSDGTTSVSLPTFPTNTEGTVVDGTVTWQESGFLYKAVGFEVTPPNDRKEGLPQAKLSVDNIGRELTEWIEASAGGKGAKVLLMQALRSEPGVIQWSIPLDIKGTGMDMARVESRLGFADVFNQPGIRQTYNKQTAPGLY